MDILIIGVPLLFFTLFLGFLVRSVIKEELVKTDPLHAFQAIKKRMKKTIAPSEWEEVEKALDECENYYRHLIMCRKNLENLKTIYTKADPPLRRLRSDTKPFFDHIKRSEDWFFHQYMNIVAVPSGKDAVKTFLEDVRARRRIEEDLMGSLESWDEKEFTRQLEEAQKASE